jgi:hypothetical protein
LCMLADSFRPGMMFGGLVLLPGHFSPHTAHQQGMNARVRSARQRSKPPSRGWLAGSARA